MTVKRKHIALLLAGALGAAVLVYFTWGRKDRISGEKPRLGRAAFSFRRQDVASLALRREGQNVIIGRKDGGWLITQPEVAPADQSVVNLLLDDLARALGGRELQVVSRGSGSYGLDPPALILELTLRSGERHGLRFGDPDPTKQLVYAWMDDSPELALLPIEIAVSADQSLLNLQDRSLLKVSSDEVRLLRLSNGNGEMMLAREDSIWKLKYPIETAADRVTVESLFSVIGASKVTEFISESAGVADSLKRDKDKITLIASLLDGSEKTLTLGTKEGGFSRAIASDRPRAGKVEGSLYDRLNVRPSDLFDRNIVRFDPNKLKRVIIKNRNQTLVAVVRVDKWVVETPSNYEGRELNMLGIMSGLKTERADEVLYKPSGPPAAKLSKPAMTALRFWRFWLTPSETAAVLSKPAITAQLVGKDGVSVTLLFSAPDGERVYVRRDGSPFVYKTGRHIFERLNFRVKDLVTPD